MRRSSTTTDYTEIPPLQPTIDMDSSELRRSTARVKTVGLEDPDPLKRTFLNSQELEGWIAYYRYRLSGWKFGIAHFATWAVVVFLINCAALVWGWSQYGDHGGVLRQGDCGQIKDLNRGLHVLINVLSTVLLSGSSYCMQCLSAPTRAEIDKAHAAGTWLDVGILSFRNLRHVRRRRLCLWVLLGLISVPLHLL